MKKIILFALATVMIFTLTACSGSSDNESRLISIDSADDSQGENASGKPGAPVTQQTEAQGNDQAAETSNAGNAIVRETEYASIDGVYVDNSYRDSDNSSRRMVYVLYTVSTAAQNLSISSDNCSMTINQMNTYESEHCKGAGMMLRSYYYRDYIEDVYVGDTLKVAATFLVPEGDLAAGRSITLNLYGIPDSSSLRLSSDDIVFCNSAEEVAEQADPEGYAEFAAAYAEADEGTIARVREACNGYYWSFYCNSVSYEIEFFSPNTFEVRTSLGITNSGTYVVRNGYISCTYDSNGETVNIPYTWGPDDIDPDFLAAFDFHEY